MIRILTALFCLLLLGLGPARTQVLTSIPASAAGDPKAFWGSVMQEFYGAYDKRAKCWMGSVGGEKLCMRPHLLSTVAVEGEPVHFVAMAGYAPGPDGGRADCHACGGKLGLVILKPSGDRLGLVARNDLAADAGSWGQVPAEEFFRVVELGKGNHGWMMEFYYTGQGYTQGGVAVFGAIGDKVVELGFISTYSDNAGNCGEGLGACYTHSYELLSDAAGSQTRFGELIARKLESTDADAPATVRIPFSDAQMKYETPPALEAALAN